MMGVALGMALLLGGLFNPVSTEAQEAARVARIGFLAPDRMPIPYQSFLQGLRDHGFVEGRNVVIEFRSAEGKIERLPALAAELVGL
jgi:putative ABC transport system substrate-binding protein